MLSVVGQDQAPRIFTTKALATLLDLTPAQVRGYVHDGFVSPRRGPRGEFQFQFQDLVLLRTARTLMNELPAKRVRHALRQLRGRLPDEETLSRLALETEGGHVVVRDGELRWEARSGQGLLDFEAGEESPVTSLASKVAHLRIPKTVADEDGRTADDWYLIAIDHEDDAVAEAEYAYRKAIELDPDFVEARINLGRICHQSGHPDDAIAQYRRALRVRAEDVTALFNLGVALEDLGRDDEALAVYMRAIEIDESCADAHYNAARLYEARGDEFSAIRHLQVYRKISRNLD